MLNVSWVFLVKKTEKTHLKRSTLSKHWKDECYLYVYKIEGVEGRQRRLYEWVSELGQNSLKEEKSM